MENLYDQWIAGSVSSTNNSNVDFLNSSQNEKSWLNSSLNLPPELRFNALNDLVSKIVDDKPNSGIAEQLQMKSNNYNPNANTEAQYFWQQGIESSASADKRHSFGAQISSSSITSSTKHESSLSPASSSSSFSLPTSGIGSKTPTTPLSADKVKPILAPISNPAIYANSPTTNSFTYDLQSPTNSQFSGQKIKYDSSQMVKVCQNQMNTPTMVSLNEFRRMIGLRDTKPFPQQHQHQQSFYGQQPNPHSAPFVPQQFDQNQQYYNGSKGTALKRPNNISINTGSNFVPNIPSQFNNSPRAITNNLDNKQPQQYPHGNFYAYAPSPVKPQFYIQPNMQNSYSPDAISQSNFLNEEQLNAYFKMQQNANYINPYEQQGNAASYLQKQSNVTRSNLDAFANDAQLKFANLQLAQNGIILPHLLTSLDDAKFLSQPYRQHRKTGPSNELHVRLEECLHQFKCLENERKKMELELIRLFPDGKLSNVIHFPNLKLPPNPSRVDRLINEILREHFKVSSIIIKMQELSGSNIHQNIKIAVDKWYESILNVQSRRRDEIINSTTRQKIGQPRINDERDVILLSNSIKELTMTTCRMRTSLWCSYQMATSFQADVSSENDNKSSELASFIKQYDDNTFSLKDYQSNLKKTFEMKAFAECDINNNSSKSNHIELTPTLIHN